MKDKINRSAIEKFKFCLDKSNECRYANNIHKAKEYALMALKIAESLEDKSYLSKAYNILGLWHAAVNEYDESLKCYQSSIDICQKINNKSLLSITLNNLAYIYSRLNNNDLALKYYLQALQYDETNFHALNCTATLLTYKHDYTKAKEYYQKAFALAEKDNYCRSQIIALINIANLEEKRGIVKESYKYLEDARKMLDNYNDPVIETYYYLQLGESLQADEKKSEAIESLNKAYEISLTVEEKSLRLECIQVLKKYYEKLSDYQNAYKYSCEEISLKETIFNKELKDKIAVLNANYENSQNELQAHKLMEKSSKLFSIGVMAAGITHEINQPLNAISVSANSILYWHSGNPDILPEMFVEEINQIAEGADRIDSIIKHMRSFWATQDEETINEMIDLNKSVCKALDLLERQLYSHGIILFNEVAEEEFLVKSNQISIEQMLINLINNAMHALDDTEKSNKKIIVKTELSGEFYLLSVCDNGTGLKEENPDILFDPFFTSKKTGKGMGLGLAIVKNLVQKMGALIEAKNNDLGGASFLIKIPVIKKEES